MSITKQKIIKDKKVLCGGCKKPIHISRFAGAYNKRFYCDALPCLLTLNDRVKKDGGSL